MSTLTLTKTFSNGSWLKKEHRREQVVHVHVSWPGLYKYTDGGPIPTKHATRKNGPLQRVQWRRQQRELCSKQVPNQHLGRAKHMLAMLWLELASLVFSGCGFDPFGLQAQSSQSKISGLPLFSGRQIIPRWLWRRKNIEKSKHCKKCGEWATSQHERSTVTVSLK